MVHIFKCRTSIHFFALKFVGNCKGGCTHHKRPRCVLKAGGNIPKLAYQLRAAALLPFPLPLNLAGNYIMRTCFVPARYAITHTVPPKLDEIFFYCSGMRSALSETIHSGRGSVSKLARRQFRWHWTYVSWTWKIGFLNSLPFISCYRASIYFLNFTYDWCVCNPFHIVQNFFLRLFLLLHKEIKAFQV